MGGLFAAELALAVSGFGGIVLWIVPSCLACAVLECGLVSFIVGQIGAHWNALISIWGPYISRVWRVGLDSIAVEAKAGWQRSFFDISE